MQFRRSSPLVQDLVFAFVICIFVAFHYSASARVEFSFRMIGGLWVQDIICASPVDNVLHAQARCAYAGHNFFCTRINQEIMSIITIVIHLPNVAVLVVRNGICCFAALCIFIIFVCRTVVSMGTYTQTIVTAQLPNTTVACVIWKCLIIYSLENFLQACKSIPQPG